MTRAASILSLCLATVVPGAAGAAGPASVYTAVVNCAPHVDRGIVVGILSRESSVSPWQPLTFDGPRLWQINDNTAKRSYSFPTYSAAVEATNDLVYRRHHVVAIGMGQILSSNLQPFNVAVADAFLPCTNLSLAQRILVTFYRYATESLHMPPGLNATHTALQLYYGGFPRFRDPDAVEYADDIMARASAFNARYSAAPPTLATLPMPDRPWPAGADQIPYSEPAAAAHAIARAPRPDPAAARRAAAEAEASAQQRRLNSLLQDAHQ